MQIYKEQKDKLLYLNNVIIEFSGLVWRIFKYNL